MSCVCVCMCVRCSEPQHSERNDWWLYILGHRVVEPLARLDYFQMLALKSSNRHNTGVRAYSVCLLQDPVLTEQLVAPRYYNPPPRHLTPADRPTTWRGSPNLTLIQQTLYLYPSSPAGDSR